MLHRCARVLLLVDVQKGFHSPYWGKRNNPQAENNIRLLLRHFRSSGMPVIHVQHLSSEENSPLHPRTAGVEFMDCAAPLVDEVVFQKSVNSAFIGTDLEIFLRAQAIRSLTVAGFTTDHCVSTTTRMAANLGFTVSLVADATVAFERRLASGTFAPELVHAVSLASLSEEFAVITSTDEVLGSKICQGT